MRRAFDCGEATALYVEAPQESCVSCAGSLWVCEHAKRFVQRIDGVYCLVRRNKWCPARDCDRFHRIERAPHDLRFALPRFHYGLDVVLEVGERHLRDGDSLRRITRELNERAVPLSQRNSCRLFRAYVALTKLARGDDARLRERLLAQGGLVLMVDGVQFDDTSPVLYLVWDALSGEPLFGERKAFRGAADLVPLLQRVRAMGVPVVGAVSDKEKGLLPAVAEVFPDVPHQLCQLHFLKNCALGMGTDLRELGGGVAHRAEKVRKMAKRLHEAGWDSVEHTGEDPAEAPASGPGASDEGDGAPPLEEEQLAAELCVMVRHAARATGRAPLHPPEHVRHQRVEAVRATVQAARKKGAAIRSWQHWTRR